MNIKQLFTDNDAVSPVIGVILMVAITVILAAVIGTFVLGLGDQVQSTSPSVSFTFDFERNAEDLSGDAAGASGSEDDLLVVTHDGGDGVSNAQLSLTANGGSISVSGDFSSPSGYNVDNPSGDFSAGDRIAIAEEDVTDGNTPGGTTQQADGQDLRETTIRVVWTSESGQNSATLGDWSGPDA